MNLIKHFEENKSNVIDKWLRTVIATYPEQSSFFLFNKKDKFANPLGWTISNEIKNLFENIITDYNKENIRKSLENLTQIRAIQDFAPSEACGIILMLKPIIQEEFLKNLTDKNILTELFIINERIDESALQMFDIYMLTREKIYEIKANEIKNKNFRMMERISRKYNVDMMVDEE
jgi:hypothetical protein